MLNTVHRGCVPEKSSYCIASTYCLGREKIREINESRQARPLYYPHRKNIFNRFCVTCEGWQRLQWQWVKGNILAVIWASWLHTLQNTDVHALQHA